jgi:nitroreductase
MSEVLDLIASRRSWRLPFDPDRPVPPAQIEALLEAARWSPSAHNMQNYDIVVVDDPALLAAVATISRPYTETFVRENLAQIAFTEEELRARKTGIMGTQFPDSWRRPDFTLSDMTDEERAWMSKPLPPSPLMLVVVYDPSRRAPASEGDFLGIISLGCVLENMWLAAESMGIALHVVSSLSSSDEIKPLLAIPDELEVAFACRLGYPPKDAPGYVRVRRDMNDFVHRNGWAGPSS